MIRGWSRGFGWRVGVFLCLFVVPGSDAAPSEPPAALPAPADFTKNLATSRGLLDLHVDRQRGKIWLSLPAAGADDGEIGRFLYAEGLATGLGSNPVGLDRGELGAARVIVLRRVGGRVLVEQVNLDYRAVDAGPEQRRAVSESFATSVLWAGEVVAEGDDGSSLVDFTPFVMRDAHGIAARLRATGQGEFALDPARSAVRIDHCFAFPENLEFEAVLTFGGSRPGELVRSVTPAPESVTLVQRQSILRLPDSGYRPRRFDPRAGSFAVRFLDYAAPLAAPLERAWIVRHRLEKTHPDRERSPVKEPIVYYVERAAPEPVRSALVEGASWWARAFEAAGFIDAFRVELLPDGVHPLDARYNVIEWVHRSTRGWSYGGGVVDPRSGEMVKGHVRLGSLRVRQDRVLFEGLLGADDSGGGGPDDPVQLALARIRQLSAHEVGHALGFNHNFAASTYGDRASVMDYPAPLIEVDGGGRLDARRAYAVGVGEWDLHAVRYAYAQLGQDGEEPGLEEIVRDGLDRGLLFLTDADARPEGAAHPLANLWDNGDDPVEQLERTMTVRRVALDRFGERNIAPGRPLASLEEVLATVYFHHRYQLEAAVKVVGGVEYSYALRGDGQGASRSVDGERQRRALEIVLDTLSPRELELSDSVVGLLLPRVADQPHSRERFGGATAPTFDDLAAAATAAHMALSGLLQPERCSRLVNQSARDPSLPSLDYVLEKMVERVFGASGAGESGMRAEIHRQNQRVLLSRLVALSSDPIVSAAVRLRVDGALERLLDRIDRGQRLTAQERFLGSEIRRHLDRPAPAAAATEPAPAPPPGSPIGSPAPADLAGCSFE